MPPDMCIHVLDQTSVARGMITACGVGWLYTIPYSWHHLAHHAEIHGEIHQAVLMSADSTCHINRPAAYYFNSIQSQPLCKESQNLLHYGLKIKLVTLLLWCLATISHPQNMQPLYTATPKNHRPQCWDALFLAADQ